MDRDRRRVLKGGAILAGGVVGITTAATATAQEIDTELPPGVVLFDLDDDGEYAAEVERAPESARDSERPRPIRVTSGGRATVDYAASIVQPEAGATLAGLDRLRYDFYRTADDGSEEGGVPGETFLVVENDDGRHGMYLTDETDRSPEQWHTRDVLARMSGDTEGTSRWFEYTSDGDYEGQTFDDVVERYGTEARLARVGIGHGNAVSPSVLDTFYGRLVVGDRSYEFPVSVARRASGANPL